MTSRTESVLVAVALIFTGLVIPVGKAQQSSGIITAVQLVGLPGIKDDAKGALRVENGRLHFVHGKKSADLSAASIEDVVTGEDSQQALGKTIGMLSMGAPYGGGRFLSLFRKKLDTLTIQYRDEDGGLHGAIFTMSVGAAEGVKKELVAQGAHTSTVAPAGVSPASSKNPSSKGQN